MCLNIQLSFDLIIFFIKILSNLNEFIIDILENQFLGKFYIYNFLGILYNIIKNFYYLSTTEDFRYTT